MKYLYSAGSTLAFAMAGFLALSSRGAEVNISGTGQASAKAEFIQLEVSVDSKCYPKATEAMSQTNSVANEIGAVFKEYARTTEKLKDVFTLTGGDYSFSNGEQIVKGTDRNGVNITETVCRFTHSSSKRVSLKLVDIDKLPELIDKVMVVIEKHPVPTELGKPRTWATLASPRPAVCAETEKS